MRLPSRRAWGRVTGCWPWPRDTALERARRIANSLLSLLPEAERGVWTARAHALGETWLGERLVTYTPDQALDTHRAADLAGVPEYEIRRWACRRHPEDPARSLLPRAGRQGRQQTYLARNVLDAAAAVRRTRRNG